MPTHKLELSKLDSAVRKFLAQAGKGKSLLVEDAQGRARYGIIPYEDATPAQRRKAWKDIQKLQKKVGRSMKRRGISEADVMRILLEDD